MVLTISVQSDGTSKEVALQSGASYRVKPGTVHRVSARRDSTLLEVSTPQLDDVIRLEDRYRRTESASS
jgi:mannose-6-phosphate isomerase